jgi:hypothetical protein
MKKQLAYSYLFLLVGFFSAFAAKASSHLIIGPPSHDDPAPKLMIGKLITNKSSEKKKVVVQGKLIDDKTKKPITGAVVNVKGTKTTVVSNTSGLYLFSIPEELKTKDLYLQIVIQGYEKKDVFIPKEMIPSSTYKMQESLKKIIKK